MTKVQASIRDAMSDTPAWPRDPLMYHVEFPFHATHYPLGFPLKISTNSESVIAAAKESWGGFPTLQSAEEIHLRIGVSEVGGEQLPPAPVFRAQRGLISIIADAENFGICDVTQGFAFGWFTAFTAADSAFFRYHFLDNMAGLLLVPRHFAIVHAACIVLNGHGVLLCGHSGAGKSTLAFACAQKGWTFVSDDAGHVPRKNPGRLVVGNPLAMRLREDASDFFPQLREQPVALRQNGELGYEITTRSLSGIATAFECEIDHIVFLNRCSCETAQLHEFSKDEARRRLEFVLEYTLACKNPAGSVCDRPDKFLDDPEARNEQKASIGELLAADVHELRYSNLDSAIQCLERLVLEGI